MSRLKPHLSYANVMATIAVFIALGGTAGAAVLITGKNVKNSSLTYKDLKPNTLGGTRIKESRLGTVPRASSLSGGYTAAKLLDRCVTGTAPVAGACVETGSRPALTWREAQLACAQHGAPKTPGRRLATVSEVIQVTSIQGTTPIALGGELTGDVLPAGDGKVAAMTIDRNQTIGTAPDTFDGRRGFRCAYSPLNG